MRRVKAFVRESTDLAERWHSSELRAQPYGHVMHESDTADDESVHEARIPCEGIRAMPGYGHPDGGKPATRAHIPSDCCAKPAPAVAFCSSDHLCSYRVAMDVVRHHLDGAVPVE